jgi:hypothetical protein
MAVYPAIANGVAICRPTSYEMWQAFAPYIRSLAMMDAVQVDERAYLVHLAKHQGITFYSMVGELFGWFILAGFFTLLGIAINKKCLNQGVTSVVHPALSA